MEPFWSTVPDLPEAITFGEDREDALARATDAIETALMGAMAAREDIGEPSARGSDLCRPSRALPSAKVALYRAMRAERVGKAALGQTSRRCAPSDRQTARSQDIIPASTRWKALSRRSGARCGSSSRRPNPAAPHSPDHRGCRRSRARRNPRRARATSAPCPRFASSGFTIASASDLPVRQP